MKKIKLFTDSSVDPELKIGFGAYVVSEEDTSLEDLKDKIKTKKFENTSSTKLELETYLWAMNDIDKKDSFIYVYTDCQNIISLLKRREKLEKNFYLTKKGKLRSNYKLYKEFYRLLDNYDIEFIKVKGHKKTALKDEIDKIFDHVDKGSRHELRKYLKKKSLGL